MPIKDIHENMLQILEDKKTLNMIQLEHKWANFMKEYPLVFISLQSEDVDLNMLKIMIDKLSLVENGEKSSDQAEKEFGTIMGDKYIYNQFEKPSNEHLDAAYQKALKNKEKEKENPSF